VCGLLTWSGALESGRQTLSSLFTTEPSGIVMVTAFLSFAIYQIDVISGLDLTGAAGGAAGTAGIRCD